MRSTVILRGRGQVTIPRKVIKALNLKTGDILIIDVQKAILVMDAQKAKE